MYKNQKHTDWDKAILRFLQISLGTLLLVLAVASILQILAPIIIEVRGAYSKDAWLGFWGNLVGGSLGLGGGLVAAYAAVRAVERQLQHAENESKISTKRQLKAYAVLLLHSLKAIKVDADELDAAFSANDIKRTVRISGSLFLAQRWVDDSLRAEWQRRAPEVAARLTLFLAVMEQHKSGHASARVFIDAGKVKDVTTDLMTASHFLRIISTSSTFLTVGSALCCALANELEDHRNVLLKYEALLDSLNERLKKHWERIRENFVKLGGDTGSNPP